MTDQITDLLDQIDQRSNRALGDEPHPHLDGPLHGRWIDHQRQCAEDSQQDARNLSAALRTVLELHRPIQVDDIENMDCLRGDCAMDCEHPIFGVTLCKGCQDHLEEHGAYVLEEIGVQTVEHPCPTVQAITYALGDDHEG